MPEANEAVENVSVTEFKTTIARMNVVDKLSADDPVFYESKARLRADFPQAHMFSLLSNPGGGTDVMMIDNRGVFHTMVR